MKVSAGFKSEVSEWCLGQGLFSHHEKELCSWPGMSPKGPGEKVVPRKPVRFSLGKHPSSSCFHLDSAGTGHVLTHAGLEWSEVQECDGTAPQQPVDRWR